mmetsp:Transcript_11724/g.39634  ORF Transcript_11724/g.39634 Transcript_11724/m.39634 type:complete len:206 (-) Transcript_11724:245-862(-)
MALPSLLNICTWPSLVPILPPLCSHAGSLAISAALGPGALPPPAALRSVAACAAERNVAASSGAAARDAWRVKTRTTPSWPAVAKSPLGRGRTLHTDVGCGMDCRCPAGDHTITLPSSPQETSSPWSPQRLRPHSTNVGPSGPGGWAKVATLCPSGVRRRTVPSLEVLMSPRGCVSSERMGPSWSSTVDDGRGPSPRQSVHSRRR